MKNYVNEGINLTIPAPDDVEAGMVVIAGTLIGVAQEPAAQGDLVVIVRRHVFDLPKVGSQAWTVGAAVYWDSANDRCTTSSSGNTLIGAAVAAVGGGSGDTTGRVLLTVG